MTDVEDSARVLIRAALAWRRHVDENGLVRADLDAPSQALFDAADAYESARGAPPSTPSER